MSRACEDKLEEDEEEGEEEEEGGDHSECGTQRGQRGPSSTGRRSRRLLRGKIMILIPQHYFHST